MANAITQMVASTAISLNLNLISPNAKSNKPQLPPLVDLQRDVQVQRRTVAWGIAGAIFGLKLGDENALAAGKRAPPAAPVEKKDPSVTGVLAKVLASKRRKEAMKEAMAKQRERGKFIDQ